MSRNSPLHLLINSTVKSTTVTLTSQLCVLKGNSSPRQCTESYWLSSFIPPELGAVISLTHWNHFLSVFSLTLLFSSLVFSFIEVSQTRCQYKVELSSLAFSVLPVSWSFLNVSSEKFSCIARCVFCKASKFD